LVHSSLLEAAREKKILGAGNQSCRPDKTGPIDCTPIPFSSIWMPTGKLPVEKQLKKTKESQEKAVLVKRALLGGKNCKAETVDLRVNG
jgi:hypothetical protein